MLRQSVVVIVALIACTSYADYDIPAPKFKILHPLGLQVSIPDESGIQLFAFHGTINKEMEYPDNGQISIDIGNKTNGKWLFQNEKLKVKVGDVMYYWLFVIKNGRGYRTEGRNYKFTVSDLSKKLKKSGFKYNKHTVQKRSSWSPFYRKFHARRYGMDGSDENFDSSEDFHHHHHHGHHHGGEFNFPPYPYHNHHHHHYEHGFPGHQHGPHCTYDTSSNENLDISKTDNNNDCPCDMSTDGGCLCPTSDNKSPIPVEPTWRPTSTSSNIPTAPLTVVASTTATDCDVNGNCNTSTSPTTTSQPQIDIRFGE